MAKNKQSSVLQSKEDTVININRSQQQMDEMNKNVIEGVQVCVHLCVCMCVSINVYTIVHVYVTVCISLCIYYV